MDTLYLLSIPFVHAFNFSQVLILPLIFAVLGLGVRLLQGRVASIPWIDLDPFIACFLGSILVSMIINMDTMGPKTLNHFLALVSGYLFFYFGAERIVAHMTVERILKILFIGYLITASFGIIEFCIVNFTSFDINSIVFRPHLTEYSPAFLDILLTRSRSFFEESGYFSGYLGVMAPLVYHYLWNVRPNRTYKIAFIALSLGAYFVAFSTALFIFLPGGILLTAFLKTISERKVTRNLLLCYLAFGIIIVAFMVSGNLWDIFFGNKLQGDSLSDRTEKFEGTIAVMRDANLLNLIFGFGPGSYDYLGVKPAISVFLNYLRDIGVFGLCCNLALSGLLLTRLFRIRTSFGSALFMSALITQLFFISGPIYYYPHFFLPIFLYRIHYLRNSRYAATDMKH